MSTSQNKTSQDCPRRPKPLPRRLQDGPRTTLRPKTAPRWLQDDSSKTTKDRPKTYQDTTQVTSGPSQDVPRSPQDAPRPLPDAPKPLQDAQRPLEDDPMIRSKTPQDSSQCTAKATPPQDHSKTVSHPDRGLDLALNIEPGTSPDTSSYARYGNRFPFQSVPKFETDSIRSLVADLVSSQTWHPIYDTNKDLDPIQVRGLVPSLVPTWYQVSYRIGTSWYEI